MEYNLTSNDTTSILASFGYGFLPLFYLVPPHHTYYETLPEVPPYVQKAAPYFILLILIESVILWYQSRTILPFNDSITSVSGGLIMQIFQEIVLKGFEVSVYVWIYNNYSMIQLPWDSPLTWWACFIGYDFFYYWFHRMAHEVNLIWSFHQMHHSSEQYNLSTALRQSALQKFGSWMFYMPMALAIPPTQYVVHKELNLLYQFWIHTEVIDKLGPLEYILNTPSHHRVHHGRNRYCIDKNYAGVFIVWDRMFGTFAAERDDSPIYYGLVHTVKTFNPITLQLFHLKHVLQSFWSAPISHKLSVLCYSPGWAPGKPRMGNPSDIPKVPSDVIPYDNPVPAWVNVYCVFHFFVTFLISLLLDIKKNDMMYISSLVVTFFIFYCLTNIGLIYDISGKAPILEVIRLVLVISINQSSLRPYIFNDLIPEGVFYFLWFSHVLSLLIWSRALYKQLITTDDKKMM